MDDQFDADLAADTVGSFQPTARVDVRGTQPRLPAGLSMLLGASSGRARDDAWSDFLSQYSRLLLKVVRRASTGHDEAMDRYAFILEQLRCDDFRRLRAFTADDRGKFTTWLVVVARRLCVDHHRHVHGRPQTATGSEDSAPLDRVARRNLIDLLAGEFDLEQVEDDRSPRPDASVLDGERHEALVGAVGALDEMDQLLLTLRFEDDLPVARIGPILGLQSRFQVHRRLKAVLAQLREALRERGFGPP